MRRWGAFIVTMCAILAPQPGCSPSQPGQPTDALPPTDAPPFSPDACKASLAQRAEVVVGAGQNYYSAIADDTKLTWEKGPQGGHHVWIALRMTGERLSGTLTTLDLEDVEDPGRPILVNHSRVVYDFTREEAGHCTLAGLRMQLDNAGGAALKDLQGHHIRVTVSLNDPDGATATGARTIVVGGDLT